jgi:hypothetical protein
VTTAWRGRQSKLGLKFPVRPFGEIPDPLAGKSFTQVVACSASPIEVEFLRPGKLYILVGTDWEGNHQATAWLREVGFREALPAVGTVRGTSFEVWLLTEKRVSGFSSPHRSCSLPTNWFGTDLRAFIGD